MKNYFLLILFILPFQQSFAQSGCNTYFVRTPEGCQAAIDWPDQLTPINKLDGANEFKIVYHAIGAVRWDENGPEPGSFSDQFLTDPSKIAGNPAISASVISAEKHRTWWGEVGFILKFLPAHLLSTHTRDSNTPRIKSFADEDMKVLNYAIHPIQSPMEILAGTRPEDYNELIITGRTSEGVPVEVAGILLKCESTGMLRIDKFPMEKFEKYITNTCGEQVKSVVKRLAILKEHYPIFAYPLKPN